MRPPIPFGKYLLLERLSVGGMAEVFKAKSFGVEGFEKILAIKRILPSMAEDQEFIEMFIDEAKIAGQLSHANICQIFELGRIGESHFIAMEYVWGKDLLQIQNRFRRLRAAMSPAMAAFVATKICEGLDYAHRKRDAQGRPLGIIHRDVSPQNVLVSYEGEIKMIDFGIAKAAGRASKTQAGVLKGKFGYMSPEQVRGLPIDRRSDVFAISTILHELLTGDRLFVADSDFATLEKVRNVDVPSARDLNRKVPEALDRIVMRGLAKSPDDRYQWANELQEELQAFLMVCEPVFTAKHLSQFMKETFSAELRREQILLETYKRVGRDGKLPDAAAGPATPLPFAPPASVPIPISLQSTLPGPVPSPLADLASLGSAAAASRPSGPTLIGTGAPSEPVLLSPAGRPGSLDTAPTAVDQPVFELRVPKAPLLLVPRSPPPEFGEEIPTDVFEGERPRPPPPPISTPLAAQPTIILGSAPTQPDPLLVIQPQSQRITPPSPLPLDRPRNPFEQTTSLGQRRGGFLGVFKDIGIGISVAAAVLLIVFGVRTALRTRAVEPVQATLVVAMMTPRDAIVRVSGDAGELRGRLAPGMPAASFKGLLPGFYDVEVLARGVAPYRRRVELHGGDAEVVTPELAESAVAQLKLNLRPAGADVFLDGVEMSADEPIALRVGAHELRVARDGFSEQHLPIEAHPGEQIEKTIELAPIRGAIEVSSEPSEGEVILDGRYRGRTPVVLSGLEIGQTYQIKVRHGGYRSASRAVPLSARAPREKVELVLAEVPPRGEREPAGLREAAGGASAASAREVPDGTGGRDSQTGFLIANTQPWARVVIDGLDTGKSTPIAPRSKIALKPGKHVVSFVVSGRKFDFEIVVKAGEDTRLIRKLDVGQ